MKDFLKLVAAVSTVLGVEELPMNEDGTLNLSSEQREKLKTYGEAFIAAFEKKFNAEKLSAGDKSQVDLFAAQLSKLQDERDEAQRALREKEGELKILKGKPEEEIEEIPVTGSKADKNSFKMNMSYLHNKSVADVFNGKISSSAATIDTTELKEEFGKYVSSDRLEIFKALTKSVDCIQYMTTKITDKDEWRASKMSLKNIMQKFVPKWTPTTGAKVTPIAVKNNDLKLNVEIIPADILESVISYLYDRNLKVEEMPITKFIINEMLMPALDDERTVVLAKGEEKDTEDGKAGNAMDSMNGYVTLIKQLKTANATIGAWVPGALVKGQYIEFFEGLTDILPDELADKKMNIFCDPQIVKQYSREYRAKYPTTKNEDGENRKIDDSNLTLVPLIGMRGTGVFFTTPQENFIHTLSTDPKNMMVGIKDDIYASKVYAQWKEGVGFAIAEYLFAYVGKEVEEIEANTEGL